MGIGALWYCRHCHKELEKYKLNPETGTCWECDEEVEDEVDDGFPPEHI